MNSGYRGRIAVYEILHVTEEIRGLIRHGAPPNEIAAAAARSGMVRLYQAGLRKVAQNATTLEEVERVLYRSNETASGGPAIVPPEPVDPAEAAESH